MCDSDRIAGATDLELTLWRDVGARYLKKEKYIGQEEEKAHTNDSKLGNKGSWL